MEMRDGPAEVFICYKRDDVAKVDTIRSALESRGVSIAQDLKVVSGGQYWADRISPAIQDCKVVLFMCSNASLNSEHVQDELALSKDFKKKIIPLDLEEGVAVPHAMKLILIRLLHIRVLDRAVGEWMPEVLTALREFGVRVEEESVSKTRGDSLRSRLKPRLIGPELAETIVWLEKFSKNAERWERTVTAMDAGDETEADFKRDTLDAIKYLENIDLSLPYLYEAFVACTHPEAIVNADEAKALRDLQQSLIHIAKAVLRFRRENVVELKDMPLPPYDLWLPFKSGKRKSRTGPELSSVDRAI